MPLNVVVLGAPGAGKGTQADVLAPEWGIPKISTGDTLRSAIAAGTPLGRSAAATLAAGHFLGDDVMIALVAERLRRPDTAAGFVLDGFPRTLPQGDALEGLMAGRGPR